MKFSSLVRFWALRRHSTQALLVACLLLVGVSGCVFWHNFSTYFNTLYLAQWHLDAYETGQNAIVPPNANGAIQLLNHRWLDEEYMMRQRSIRDGDPIPITPSFSQSLSATKQITNVHLDSAIILGSKILADKTPSEYVEDALFVVGKAQFYKNDFVGAQRKFLELLYKFPQTKYGAEVQVFLTRATLLNHHLDTANAELDHALAMTTATDDKLAVSDLHRAKAELIYAENHDSLAAIANELHLAENGLEGEQFARLAYEEGAVDYMISDWPSAERAFQTTYENAKDDQYLMGEAHVAHALAERESGDLASAKTELQAVVARAKFGGSHGPARYELAYTDELIARKDVGNNLRSSEFHDVQHPLLRAEYFVLDTMYKNSSALILSRSKFRQAEMFREMGNYDSAAKMAAGLIGTKDFSTPAMNSYVSDQASSLASFSRWRAELDHIDSLEAGLSHKAPMPKPGGQFRSQPAANHLRALQEALGTRWNPSKPPELTKQDSFRVQEIEKRMKDKPDAGNNAPLAIKDTSHFLDSLHWVAATAHYQLGRAYETFGEIGQARLEYIAALGLPSGGTSSADSAKTVLLAQTLYAWLTLESHEKNEVVKDSLLHELLAHYGQTIYAEQARAIYIGIDRNSLGELAYKAAYERLRALGVDTAKPALLQIVVSYPQDDVAPRSLYAIGETYEELIRYDSALVYYRRLQREYPFSSYALALRPRLADAGSPGLHAPAQTIDPTLIPQGQPVPNNMNTLPANSDVPQNGNGQQPSNMPLGIPGSRSPLLPAGVHPPPPPLLPPNGHPPPPVPPVPHQ